MYSSDSSEEYMATAPARQHSTMALRPALTLPRAGGRLWMSALNLPSSVSTSAAAPACPCPCPCPCP